MGTIRPMVVFVRIVAIFCFVGSTSDFGRFGDMNTNRQAVFFMPVLVKSCFVNSNFSLDDLAYNLLNHIEPTIYALYKAAYVE